jgi:hypothetical protein
MSSLEACIRKSGKALRKEDADAIRKIRDDIYGVGDVSRDAANQNAVDEYIQILDEERDAVVNQIEERGGVIADRRLSPSDFATKTAERIEEEARKFPRIGMQRETDHRLDMLTMSPEQLHNILTQFDPDLASEILKANGGIEAIRPLQGEARTTVVDLYIENIEPFLSGEPALRYMKDLFGKEIPEPKEKKPEKVETQEDMFGAVTERQRLADFRRRQDRARDEGQEEVETGDVGDLFSQAREQVDIEDVAPSYEIVPNEIQGGFSVLKNNKMMSEWFATEANAQDRIDILTGVREQSVEEAVDESLKKGNNLKYKVEDTFERDNVDANPDNPMAIVAKYGVQMQKAAETTPTKRGGFRGMIDGLVNSGEMHINGILAAVPQSKLKDFIRYGMASVKDYVNEVKLMDAFMNEMMEGHAELGKKWLKFNNANKDGAKLLGEFMHASSLAGVDPLEYSFPDAATFKKMNKTVRKMWIKRRADHKELMPFWERLGGMGKQVDYTHEEYNAVTDKYIKTYSMKVSEAQEIYLNVRDTYAEQRTRVIHGLELRILQSEADDASKVKLITQLRRQFEVGKIVPYFPLQRFGKYWVIAKDPEDTDKVVGFFKRENRKDRNKLVAELREAGFVAFPAEEMATDFAAVNKIDPNFVTAVTGLLKEADVVYTDPETGEKTTQPGTEISDEIWQLYLKSLPEMSARKAYIHRKGRLGFTHDALRAFGDNTFHGTHQLAKLKHGYELNRKLRDTQVEAEVLLQQAAMIDNMEKLDYRPEGYEDESMHTVLLETAAPEYHQLYLKYQKENGTQDDPTIDQEAADRARAKLKAESEHDGDWAVPVAKELAKRHEYTMNPKSAAWATNATAFGFMWFLSSSPAAGVLNLTQTAISAYPILRAKFMGAGAGMALWKAFGEYSAIPFSIKQTRIELYGNKLENDKFDDPTQPGKQLQAPDRGEKAALEYFNKIGMFAKTRTRELMGFAERGGQFGGKWQKAAELTGWIFHKSEEMNRVVTAMAAYRLARRKLAGDKDKTELDKHTEAVELAEELVEMSHYDYTNTNRPRLMQGDLGRVVFLFRNYSLNMQYRLIRDFKDGIWKNKNIPEQDRIEARQRFVGIIGMTSMFAGLSGWPLMAGTRFLLDTILGDDDEPFDSRTELRKWMTEAWGETASEAIWKGPWDTMTQATLSSRASLNNLWIREFPQNLRGKDLLLHLAGEGLGPVFGIGLNYMQGFSDLGGGHTDRAIERFVPKAVSDVMKTIRFAQQGAQTYQKDMIMSPEEFTSWDLSVQFMGFTPANLTLRYEQNRAIKDMEARLKTRRTHILNVLFSAYKLGDRAGARDAMQAVLAWNRANPRYPIDANTILRSAQTRAAYDLRTVGGIAVDKRLQYLQNELRFTKRRRRQ